MNVAVKFLNFKKTYTYFIDHVAVDGHSTHNKVQFGGCLMKISRILSILQRL